MHGLTGARRSIRPALLHTIMPVGHIHPANLPPAQKETGFRPKIFRNR